jgi:membrane protease YdiL (CAAX protease family)
MDISNTSLEPRAPQWGLAGTLCWGIVIAIITVIIQTLAVIGYAIFIYGDFSEELLTGLEYNGTALSIATFATFIFCSLLIFGIIKLKRNSNIGHYLALNTISLSEVKKWVLVIIALIVLTDSLTYLLGKPIVVEFMIKTHSSADIIWLFWIALIVAAPIFEELFFRVFLFAGLSSSFLGPIGAILVTSATWAAVHLQYDLYGIISIFVVGVVLGIARFTTGSILTTIMMHSIMNLVATVQTAIYMAD